MKMYSIILAHDYCRGENGAGCRFDTIIGKNCVIGISGFIMPKVRIDESIVVGAGAYVTKDIQSHFLVAGIRQRL